MSSANSESKKSLSKKALICLDIFLIVFLTVVDQISKILVTPLKTKDAIVIIKDVFEIRYLENHGAAFGMMQNQKIIFLIITAVVLTLISYFIAKIPEEKKFIKLNISLAIIIAGAIGNLIDRVYFSYVRDFLYFKLIDFPIFNIADCYITIATAWLAIMILFFYKDEDFKFLSGTTAKNVVIEGYNGDVMFTHFGLTGPLIYTISSLKAFNEFPYELIISFIPKDINIQEKLNSEPHKNIKNILSQYIPSKLSEYVLSLCNINSETKAHLIDGKSRELILKTLQNFKVNITGTNKGEETVTAGGIDLNEINSKDMSLKKYPKIYAIGEVLNIDGLCGGFNLQNAWSTAYVCAEGILSD